MENILGQTDRTGRCYYYNHDDGKDSPQLVSFNMLQDSNSLELEVQEYVVCARHSGLLHFLRTIVGTLQDVILAEWARSIYV